MDQKAIENDIKNYKVREGPLYKRSKFLKEWRQRWVVLTTSNLYTFTTKNLDQVTDVIDLKEIKSYKSYLRKDEEMIPPGFKIRTGDDMIYLCAKNCNEKWSWIVSFERLMDYKYVGTSSYNNAEWIKTKGFQSQNQFEGLVPRFQPPVKPKTDDHKKNEEPSKNQTDEIQKLMKQIEQQKEELEKRKLELDIKEAGLQHREKSVTADLKKIQDEKKELEEERKLVEEAKQKQAEQKEEPKAQEIKQLKKAKEEEETKQVEAKKCTESPVKTEFAPQPSVSALRSMYESKKSQTPQAPKPTIKIEEKKANKIEDLSVSRSKVVTALFEEFRKEAPYSNVLKYVTEFLVNVGGDEKCGYSPFVIIEGKTNRNNKQFAEVFIELLSVFDNTQNCENLMKFYEICIFQIPNLFNDNQISKAQLKLKELFKKVDNEDKLALILKNMHTMNKIKKFQKDDLHAKLEKLVSEGKNEIVRVLAIKLQDDLDK